MTKRAKNLGNEQQIEFENNGIAQILYGSMSENLKLIKEETGAEIIESGNQVKITGDDEAIKKAKEVLTRLFQQLKSEEIKEVTNKEIKDVLAAIDHEAEHPFDTNGAQKAFSNAIIKTDKRTIKPRNEAQAKYIGKMRKNELVFGIGPAGTGKTYLAVAMAVEQLIQNKVGRIILSRPAVEAGEKLGFLPGDLKDKVDPYMRPLYDALHDTLSGKVVANRMENGDIEVAPLAFMRGRTLSNAFVILDEAQNTTPEQMKMFLTRLGEGSQMVINGDLTQIDLPKGQKSGLQDAFDTVKDVKGVAVHTFEKKDVVRHALVTRIVDAYDTADARRKQSTLPQNAITQGSDADPTPS
jgi:phosphate starvation-inducible PhoH-like protein